MSNITDTQITAWKKQHGDVYKITVDGRTGYVRKPNRKDLSYAGAAKGDSVKSAETLLNACWLGGDEEIKTNDELFFGAIGKMSELLQVKEAELEKL